MEELYLETKDGNKPIDENIAQKYSLEKGTMSPFSQNRIIGKNGEFYLESSEEEESEASIKKDFNEMPSKGLPRDGVDQMENGFELSTSEIIDFSQGVDSL